MTDKIYDEEAIFKIACQIASPEARVEYLHQICGDNEAIFGRVESLLRVYEDESEFLELPAQAVGVMTDIPVIPEKLGTQIGPYKLLQVIGEGGMGVVYMAEQTEPVKRKVALKLIKPGMDSRQVIARFEAERQALAMMDHVNIARVLDAGTIGFSIDDFRFPIDGKQAEQSAIENQKSKIENAGRPYFVMELIHGVTITKYCDDNHLTPRERLELFVPVCQAIQHAHQKGIIHRDIKPSNVMITLYDGKPVPKVIDFGVAKATEQKLTERTLFTQYGTMVGTLEYMSPEQAEMSALGVDTRSDIYSLGVLLYELLTGSTPLIRERVRGAAFAEVLRRIKEEEPPRPSTRLSESGESLASISAQRQMEPAQLTKLMRGELDWIVMKTLEKDRNRRYETANGFAADVQRYLNDEPVQACPPSAGYRMRKFAHRNRGAMVMAGIVAVALVVGTAVSAWQAVEATASRNLADQRLVLANDRLASETQAYQEADRQRKAAAANLQRAIDAVDQMLTRIGDEKLRDIPRLEAVHIAVLGDALKFYEALLSENARDPVVRHRTAMGFHRMAWALNDLPDPNDPERELVLRSEAHRLLDELHEQYPGTAIYAFDLAAVEITLGWFRPRGPQTDKHFQRAIELLEPLAANPPRDLTLDSLLFANGRHSPAIVPPDIARRNPRESVAHVLLCYLANAYRVLGESYALRSETRRDEGVLLFHKAIQTAERAPGWSQSVLGWCYVALTYPYESSDRLDDALASIDKSLEQWHDILQEQPDSYEYRWHQINCVDRRAVLLLKADRANDSLVAGRDALAAVTRLSEDFPTRKLTQEKHRQIRLTLIAALRKLGRTDEADELQRIDMSELLKRSEETLTQRNAFLGPNHPTTLASMNTLAWFLATCADASFRNPLRAVDLAEKVVKLDPQNSNSQNTLGVAQYRAGDCKAAIDSLKRSEELQLGTRLGFNGFFLAMAYCQLGEKDEARKWYDQAVDWMDNNQPKDEEMGRFRAEAAELLGIAEKALPAAEPAVN